MSGPSDTFVIMLRLTSSDMKNIFFFNDTATTEIYTLSLHDALPILCAAVEYRALSLEQAVREMLHGILPALGGDGGLDRKSTRLNSSHGYISYAVFCLKKKKQHQHTFQPQHDCIEDEHYERHS